MQSCALRERKTGSLGLACVDVCVSDTTLKAVLNKSALDDNSKLTAYGLHVRQARAYALATTELPSHDSQQRR